MDTVEHERRLTYALKLLATSDMPAAQLRSRLEARFGVPADDIVDEMLRRRFLDDRRFTEAYVERRRSRGRLRLMADLVRRGVDERLAADVLDRVEWPSIQSAAADTIQRLRLRLPLSVRDAGRLFRHLGSLGYDEEEIRYAVERLHEQ